jgi:16S rRNA (cytidine1402-2'-O)-methyltransferase
MSELIFATMLYIVATPIGNLEDITLRALRILKEVDMIAAEDTRTSGILLKKYEINTRMISFHAFSDERKVQEIVNELLTGKKVALISDAGTPGISDPGFVLIRAARAAGIKVEPIPGPSAFLTALSASGLPINHFLYLGFLPMKKGRQTMLKKLQSEENTVVFYESPHRIAKTLKEFSEYFPERKLVIARELTKMYEEFLEGKPAELAEIFNKKTPKGEFVVIMEGFNAKADRHGNLEEEE